MPLLLALTLFSCARIEVPPGSPPDQQGPSLRLITPTGGACNQSSDLRIAIEFSEYVNRGATLKALRLSPELPSGFQAKWRGKQLFLHPRTPFPKDRSYTFEIGPGCQDLHGNPLVDPFRFSFSTGSSLDSLEIHGRLAATSKSAQCLLWKANDPNAASYSHPTWRTYPDSEGHFTFRALPEGNYRLLARDGDHLFGSALALPSALVQSAAASQAKADPVFMRLSMEPFIDSLSLNALRWVQPDMLALKAIVEPTELAHLRAHDREGTLGDSLRRDALWISHGDHPILHPLSFSKGKDYITLELPFDGDSTILSLWLDGCQDTLTLLNAPLRVDSLMQADTLSVLAADSLRVPKIQTEPRASKKSKPTGALSWSLNRLPEHSHWRIVLLGTEEEFELPLREEGTFEALPEGRWPLASYLDKNGNQQWDAGQLSPFRHAEPWVSWPDTLEVIANWTREGIEIKLPKEIL
jgi:hypothetical protein